MPQKPPVLIAGVGVAKGLVTHQDLSIRSEPTQIQLLLTDVETHLYAVTFHGTLLLPRAVSVGVPGLLERQACQLALVVDRCASAACSTATLRRTGHGAWSDVCLTRDPEAFSGRRDLVLRDPARSRKTFPVLAAQLLGFTDHLTTGTPPLFYTSEVEGSLNVGSIFITPEFISLLRPRRHLTDQQKSLTQLTRIAART